MVICLVVRLMTLFALLISLMPCGPKEGTEIEKVNLTRERDLREKEQSVYSYLKEMESPEEIPTQTPVEKLREGEVGRGREIVRFRLPERDRLF